MMGALPAVPVSPRRSVMSRRLTVGVLLFGASALALVSLPRPEPVAAQQKGGAAMQAKIQQLEAANVALRQQVAQLQAENKQLQTAAGKTTKDDKTKDDKSKDLQTALDGFKNAGLVHVVV